MEKLTEFLMCAYGLIFANPLKSFSVVKSKPGRIDIRFSGPFQQPAFQCGAHNNQKMLGLGRLALK